MGASGLVSGQRFIDYIKPVRFVSGPRGYSWPPFETENTAALKHGGTSDRVLSPIAARWRGWLAEVAPWTSMPMFARDVEAWAWHEAECEVYRAWFDERGIIDDDGGPAGYERWKRADAAAKEARAALGIRPTAWAKFVASLGSADSEVAARSLENLKSIGRELEAATRDSPTRAIGDPDG